MMITQVPCDGSISKMLKKMQTTQRLQTTTRNNVDKTSNKTAGEGEVKRERASTTWRCPVKMAKGDT